MALAHADDAGVLRQAVGLLGIPSARGRVVLEGAGTNGPFTSSAGRLFDAVAALTGVCRRAGYEGEPAILLEQAAASSATFEYPFDIPIESGALILDTRPVVAAVIRDLAKGRSPADVAGRFHRTMAAAVLSCCRLIRGRTGLERVCLAGDLFQNDLLLSDLAARLQSFGFEVYAPRAVPPGDGGIALGQVLVAQSHAGDGNG